MSEPKLLKQLRTRVRAGGRDMARVRRPQTPPEPRKGKIMIARQWLSGSVLAATLATLSLQGVPLARAEEVPELGGEPSGAEPSAEPAIADPASANGAPNNAAPNNAAPNNAAPNNAAPNNAAAEPLPWQHGPQHVPLGNDLAMDLPEGYMFLDKAAAGKALERMGNFHNEDILGLATSRDEKADWFVVISYDAEGYVKDDEPIDADDLLSSMREGNEQANEERTERGFKPLTLDGWAEPPHYDSARHQLVWALTVSDVDGKS